MSRATLDFLPHGSEMSESSFYQPEKESLELTTTIPLYKILTSSVFCNHTIHIWIEIKILESHVWAKLTNNDFTVYKYKLSCFQIEQQGALIHVQWSCPLAHSSAVWVHLSHPSHRAKLQKQPNWQRRGACWAHSAPCLKIIQNINKIWHEDLKKLRWHTQKETLYELQHIFLAKRS